MRKILDLCKDLEEKEVEPYQIIMEEGGRSKRIFIMIEGEVVIEKEGVEINSVSEPGSIFGEMSILLDKPHMATVKTTARSRFYVADNGMNFLKSDMEISFAISRLLATRLNGVTSYLVDLKNQYQDHGTYHFTIVDTVLENILHQQDDESDLGSDRVEDSND